MKSAMVGVWLALSAAASLAANAVPSCYDTKLAAPAARPPIELIVVIDQTTLLDDGLKQSVANQIRPFLAPGNIFSVLVFSAYTQGKYTQQLTSGQLDVALASTQRNDVSKPVLSKYDQCMTRQSALAAQIMGAALRTGFEGTQSDIAKSDILGSLKDIAGKVRNSTASEKVVLLVSDMLENSTVSSFYKNQAVRKIDPMQELQLTIKSQFIADFGGARVYVIGAGLLNNLDKKNTAQYRDPKTLQALATFWRSYFENSNAQLIEFGTPALLNQIK
jgi:hypothetical protein